MQLISAAQKPSKRLRKDIVKVDVQHRTFYREEGDHFNLLIVYEQVSSIYAFFWSEIEGAKTTFYRPLLR